jgi:hypothetical protein
MASTSRSVIPILTFSDFSLVNRGGSAAPADQGQPHGTTSPIMPSSSSRCCAVAAHPRQSAQPSLPHGPSLRLDCCPAGEGRVLKRRPALGTGLAWLASA